MEEPNKKILESKEKLVKIRKTGKNITKNEIKEAGRRVQRVN